MADWLTGWLSVKIPSSLPALSKQGQQHTVDNASKGLRLLQAIKQ